MKKIILTVLFSFIFVNIAQASRIDPNLDLIQFWKYSQADQNDSIDIMITQYGSFLRNNGKYFNSDFTSKTDGEKINSMRGCMQKYGIDSASIGQTYVLCISKLQWVNGADQ